MYLVITFVGFIISLFLYFLVPSLKKKQFVYCVSVLGAASLMWTVDFIIKGSKEGWNTLFTSENLLYDSLLGLGSVLLVALIYIVYVLITNRKNKN